MEEFCKKASTIAMVVIFFVMFMLVADIIIRFFSENKSILGTYELTELGMVVIIFLSMAITEIEKGHVHVTLFTDRLPYRARNFLAGIITAITTIVCFMVAYTGLLQGFYNAAGKVTTAVLFVPISPFYFVIAFGMFLYTIVLAINTVDYFANAFMQKKEGAGT